MKKTLLILVALGVIVASCNKETTYTDGSYNAEYDFLDTHGWKAFISIEMDGDEITDADFDYYDADMNRKTEDADYNTNMFNIFGITNPETYAPEIEANIKTAVIVPSFSGHLDAVAGATHSVENAGMLLAAALENALGGISTTAIVAYPFYVDGVYTAMFDTLDTHGWKAFLSVTLTGDVASAVDFDYYNAEMERKSEDTAYNSNMFNVFGITNPETYCPQLEAQVEAATIRPALDTLTLDGVVGATHSSHNLEMLLEALLESAHDGETTVDVVQPDVAEEE